jgi:signal transduction histidine kinase
MSVASDLDLTTLLQRIVEAAQDLVGAQYAALGVLDPTRTFFMEFITCGVSDEQRAEIGDLPKGHGILGLLIGDPRPIRLPDLGEHPLSFGFPPNHPPMTSFLGVPLYVRGEVFGNLYLTDKLVGDAFSGLDEELAVNLATAAAMAIENARLHERASDLTLIADRERIGRDLHDKVIQRLFATGLSMQGTARLAETPAITERMERHIDEIDGTIREIRAAIFEFESPNSSGPSLRRDVLDAAARSARLLGFEPTVHFEGPIDALVSDVLARQLLAVLREALSNVARHAASTHVEVTLRADSALLLEVLDDGKGGTESPRANGNGLRNITSRAEELGGHVVIATRPEGGTRVEWIVPLAAG